MRRSEADKTEPESDGSRICRSLEGRHFIEDIGLFFEEMGLPRMGGRILGVLLIADPPAQSINDLCDILDASKGAVSINARLLVESGLIERVASPVPRRDYFRFKPGGWLLFMQQRMKVMAELHRITERGLELIRDDAPELRERLMEAHDMFAFIEEEMPGLLQRWEKSRPGKKAR